MDWKPGASATGEPGWVSEGGEFRREKPGSAGQPGAHVGTAEHGPLGVRMPKGFTPGAAGNRDPRFSNGPNPTPQATRPELTLDQAKAVLSYTGDRSRKIINEAIRDGKPVPRGSVLGRLVGGLDPAKVHADLQSAFAAAPVAEKPFTLQRAITVGNPDEFAAFFKGKAAAGEPVTLPGYQSTSVATGGGDPFAGKGQYSGNVHFVIHAVHGLDVKPYSKYPGENEVLLNHGSDYKVGRVESRDDGLHVELFQYPPKAAT